MEEYDFRRRIQPTQLLCKVTVAAYRKNIKEQGIPHEGSKAENALERR